MWETQETWVWSMFQEYPRKEEMATHSSILAWKKNPMDRGVWQSTVHWGCKKLEMTATQHTHTHTSLAPKDDFISLGGTRYIILGIVNHYFSKWELSTLFLKIPRTLRERWEANLVLMGRCWGRSNTKRGLCVGVKLHVLSRKWGETQLIFILVPYKNRRDEDAQSHWQPHLFEEEYPKWNPQGCTGWEGNHLVPTWPCFLSLLSINTPDFCP